MKRLVAAHKVLLLVAVTALVGVIGFVGYSAWQQMSANAGDAESLATLSAEQRQYADKMGTRNGCFLAGRVWGDVNNICRTECRAAGVKYVKANDAAKGHCEGYIAVGMDPAHCIRDLHRYFILEAGCARRTGGDSANDARQCIPGYPNYLNRDGQDRCVVREVERSNPTPTPTPTPTPPPNPTPTPTPQPVAPPKTDTAKDCRLLGRTWNAEEKKCRAVCMDGAGSLLTGAKSGVKYCNKAVSVTKQGNQNGCEDKLHRVWLVEGCARRPDQKDATRSKTELLIQCQPGFNFYNADFNNKAEDTETLRDVCELNKATALLNEQSGNPGHQTIPRDPEVPGGNQGPKDPPNDPNEPSGEGYKIIVYTERDFKGASLIIKGDSPELKNGWDNNIESYKIISGRWQLCEDAGYQTNCIKPWASDTDMRLARKDDGKKKNAEQQRLLDEDNLRTSLVNRVSSLRPVSLKTFEDTANDVMPSCQTADGTEVLALENGFCPKGTVLTCPDGLVLKNRECKQVVLSPSLIVPVDKSFKKDKNGERDCRLLGREWIGEPEDGEVDNGGNYGCSIVTCRLERDGRPKRVVYNPQDQEQKATDTFCISYKHDAPYAVKLDKDPKESKKKCDERNRVWIQQVRLCAQVPNRKDRNQVVVDAEQCVGSGRIYYIFKETTKMDECFTQTLFERAQSVAKSTGGVLSAALKQGPRAYCNTLKSGNYHWNGEKCVIDRKTCPDGRSVPVTSVCHKVCSNGKRIPVTKQCPTPAPTPDSNTDSDADDKNVQGPTTKHLPCATYRNQYDRYIGCVVPRASGLSFRLVCHLYDGRESGAYYRTSPKHVVGSTTYIADNACGFAN